MLKPLFSATGGGIIAPTDADLAAIPPEAAPVRVAGRVAFTPLVRRRMAPHKRRSMLVREATDTGWRWSVGRGRMMGVDPARPQVVGASAR